FLMLFCVDFQHEKVVNFTTLLLISNFDAAAKLQFLMHICDCVFGILHILLEATLICYYPTPNNNHKSIKYALIELSSRFSYSFQLSFFVGNKIQFSIELLIL
ncbi:hypothetical protein ACJX0J_007409, partial [Zea mays]